MNLYYHMVSDGLKETLAQLMEIDQLKTFRLVGGTALALQLGHRSSVDIDLFAGGNAPSPQELSEILKAKFSSELQITRFQRFGITATINNVKVDLYDWKVPFSNEPIVFNGIRMATIEDIFAFKCEALLGRRVEKDFADLSEIAQHVPFDKLFSVFQQRYNHISKSAVVAIMLKPSSFERDPSIHYAPGKSWENYCIALTQAITQYENQLMSTKVDEMEEKEKKIQELINQKRNKNP